MRTMKAWPGATILMIAAGLVLAACDREPTAAERVEATEVSASLGGVSQAISVSGSAVFFSTTEIVHSQEPTETGMLQRSTVIVELTGDLNGYVLFHPTSTFDFATGTLVNTGVQIFSGTIAGSDPVILHDDEFRFEVDLATGGTTGEVHLSRGNDAPHKGGWYDCHLVVVGTGKTPEGDLTSDYSGECTGRGTLK